MLLHEEQRQIRRAQLGDEEAFEQLVEAHRQKIRREARHLQVPGIVEEEDLVQEGLIGLLEAIRRFDPQRGAPLWPYAVYWVQRRMIELCCRERDLSEKARKAFRGVKATWGRLFQEKEREPTDQEVAAASGLDLDTVQEVLRPRREQAVPIADDRREDPEGEGPAEEVVASPWTPEDELTHQEGEELEELPGIRTVLERLGPKEGPKLLILFLLCEHVGYEWSPIVQLLADPAADSDPTWADVCDQFSLPRVIPRTRCEVCARFRTPPPKLTEEALRQWYHRSWKRIRAG